ncbi:MAG: hypothetical protein PHE92_02540 [Candidatus Cloacimonetes bacterium]|nr:hypothetical protein [Candidatus Cloacimonadota bacterium]
MSTYYDCNEQRRRLIDNMIFTSAFFAQYANYLIALPNELWYRWGGNLMGFSIVMPRQWHHN